MKRDLLQETRLRNNKLVERLEALYSRHSRDELTEPEFQEMMELEDDAQFLQAILTVLRRVEEAKNAFVFEVGG